MTRLDKMGLIGLTNRAHLEKATEDNLKAFALIGVSDAAIKNVVTLVTSKSSRRSTRLYEHKSRLRSHALTRWSPSWRPTRQKVVSPVPLQR